MVENYKIADSNYADYENEVNEEIYSLYDYLPVLYKDENEIECLQKGKYQLLIR